MGFNTVAVILNDQVHEFKKDGPVGERLYRAVVSYPPRENRHLDCWFGAGQVVSQAHADHFQVVVAGHNTGWSLWHDDVPQYAIDAVVQQLKRRGYKVTAPKSVPSQDLPKLGGENG